MLRARHVAEELGQNWLTAVGVRLGMSQSNLPRGQSTQPEEATDLPSGVDMLTAEELAALRRNGEAAIAYGRREFNLSSEDEPTGVSPFLSENEG
jgi:hypothetical protein